MNALRNAEVMILKQWIVQLPEARWLMQRYRGRLLNSDSRPNAFLPYPDVFAAAVILRGEAFSSSCTAGYSGGWI